MSSVPAIISNQLSSYIRKSGILPCGENNLSVNFVSQTPYCLLNQSLLYIHRHNYGFNSPLYGTYKQIMEHSGRLRPGAEGMTTIFMKRFGLEEDPCLGIQYYWSFNLEQSDLYNEFKCLEPEKDPPEEAEQIIRSGFNKLQTSNPINNQDYPNIQDYYAASIQKLVELVPHNKRENSLVGNLATSYLLSKAGYSSKQQVAAESLAKKIRDEPGWTINTFNQSQRIINFLCN